MPNSARVGEVYFLPHKTLRFNLNDDICSRHPIQNLTSTTEEITQAPLA